MGIRSSAVLLGMFAVILLLGVDRMAAQRGGGRNQTPARYDTAAEVTVSGTVEDVRQIGGPGPGTGTHVTLKGLSETVELALGPSWYMAQKKYTLAKGDRIETIGAKTQVDGRDVLLVREIKKGSDTMTFRDAKGFPLWSGRGRR